MRSSPGAIELEGDEPTDCRVCGLGSAFASSQNYDTCGRCGWVDDPAAYAAASQKAETNDESFNAAKASWPSRLMRRLMDAPLSTFAVAPRPGEIGGFDFLVDGGPLRRLFPRALNLKAAIGPWRNTTIDWYAPVRTGVGDTATGRTRLYVCPQCGGDDYELMITADIHISAERVVWSRIGLESWARKGTWALDVRHAPEGYAFDAEEYRLALRTPNSDWR